MTESNFFDRLGDDLIRDEGVKLKPYRCPAGRLTIGVGRNLDDNGISETEAMYLLEGDMIRVVNALERELPWYEGQAEEVRRALANMALNLGVAGLLKFRKMLAALERGDRVEAAQESLESDWARQCPERAGRIAALLRGANGPA